MAHAAADIASMVFRQAVIKETGAFSLDRRMLAILVEFDGIRTVAEIARRLNVDPETVFMTVRRLSALGLIEPVTDNGRTLSPAAIAYLTRQLARAVGPLAVILVEDAIQDLGYEPDGFPVARLNELIARLCTSIRKENKKKDFLNAVKETIQIQ